MFSRTIYLDKEKEKYMSVWLWLDNVCKAVINVSIRECNQKEEIYNGILPLFNLGLCLVFGMFVLTTC